MASWFRTMSSLSALVASPIYYYYMTGIIFHGNSAYYGAVIMVECLASDHPLKCTTRSSQGTRQTTTSANA